MIPMRSHLLVFAVLATFLTSCARQQPATREEIEAIVGSWNCRLVEPSDRPFSLITCFALRPDSSIACSMVFETGPRSRVWSPDADVDILDGVIRWDSYEGTIGGRGDSMIVTWKEAWGDSKWLYVRDRSADSLMVQLAASKGSSYEYGIPEVQDDGWPCANLTTIGADPTKILELILEIRRGEHGDIHSLLIAVKGQLVVEEYFAEAGSRHGSFVQALFRKQPHHLASTTKAITSLLVGIAIDHGFIGNVGDPIYRYLPAYEFLFTEEKKRITIRDMLTMTPGFEWRQFKVGDEKNDGVRMWRTGDVIRFVLEKPLVASPGLEFNYSNGTPTVTGAILKNASRKEVRQFAEEYLFQPLGISAYGWTSYPDGSVETDGGLALRSRDLAKIGQLVLNKGIWNGSRIVSEDWIRESIKERLRFGGGDWGYGYHWMQGDLRVRDDTSHVVFVPGDGNQLLAVVPQLELVIVFTAGNYGVDPKETYASLLVQSILPGLSRSERP
jgi:CubicO group peptidase (beta-lactamase class C family)